MDFLHQRKIFSHVLTPLPNGTLPYETFIFSTVKKSGKTIWLAAVGAWWADQMPHGTEIYSLANDLEQAEGRAMREMKYHAEREGLETQTYKIKYPGGTFIQVLSSHYTSAAGAHQSLTLWDELWGYQSEKSTRLWEEMTPIPTEKMSLRMVVTYAGFENESDLLWDLYEKTVVNGIRLKEEFPDLPCYTSADGSIFCYWDHDPRLPWQTPEYYEKQLITLRPSQFMRLHRNQWASSEDVFIDIGWWDRATQHLSGPVIHRPDDPHSRFPIYVGVDVGVKHDSTAIVGVWYDYAEKKMGIAFCDIWEPTKGEILDLEVTVENHLKKYHSELNVVSIKADPTHFYRSITGLRKEGLPIDEFSQSGQNMLSASSALYDALQYETLKAYPHPELRKHLRYAVAKPQGSGYRIVKPTEGRQPVDGAIALAIAVFDAIAHGGVDISKEQTIKSPFSDLTGYQSPDAGKIKGLPEELGGPRDWSQYPPELRPDHVRSVT
jgi:phage terminase large subunit-like protein